MSRIGMRRVLLFAWTALAVTASLGQEAQPADAPISVTLPPSLLETVTLEDNRPRMQPEEFDAYYWILDHARRVELQRLQAVAREFLLERRATYPKWRDRPENEFPTFVDLFRNPQAYHGKPVTLSGHVRKYRWGPAEANRFGIDTLHELWLFTESSQANPVLIVCTSIPEGFPTDAELIEHVSVTGYFFKMYVYEAQDAYRVAPMVLAGKLQWRPLPENALGPVPAWVYPVVAVVLVSVVIGLWWVARKDRALREKRAQLQEEGEHVDLQGLVVDESFPVKPHEP